MPLSPGQTLNNRYRIVRLLGQGGFGAVYRAWDTNLDEPVALKESFETSPSAQKQFQLEAKLLFRVHDTFVIPDQGMYLVMDYIEGQDLESMLQKADQPLPVTQVVGWIGQICDALSYLHAQNPPVIHRDLKPANIRITPDGRAVLVDFGIAKVFDESLQTTTGARALTPGFAPLEQYGQGKTDARTDIYALGATLYALLTGQRPLESVQRTIKDGLTPPEQINPLLSGSLAGVIRRAMEIDPNRRFQSASEFKRALQTAGQSELIAPATVAPTLAAHTDLASKPSLAVREQPSSGLLRWGMLGGVALLGLIGVIILFSLSLVLYNRFGKKAVDISVTPSAIASATLSAASTQTVQPTQPPAPTSTTEIQPTSTLFTQAKMPDDIPIMPEAENVQVFEITQGNNMLMVSFSVQAGDAEIIAYYEGEMPAYGWEKMGDYSDANSQIVYFQKDTRVAMVVISHASGQTMVSINITQQ
jgi:serine/threonine protein kinase